MKKIKNFLSPKILLLSAACVVAVLASFAYAKNLKEKKVEDDLIWRSDFERNFFGSDIFAEMEATQKRINKIFEEHQKMMEKIFDDSKKTTAKPQSSSSLSLHQEKDFYRYELIFSNFKEDEIAIGVEGKILTIAASSKKSGAAKSKEFYRANDFYYSLPLPSDSANSPEISREKGKIIVKFARLKE